jgi:hypothetical protein
MGVVLEQRRDRRGREIEPGVFHAFAGAESVGEMPQVSRGSLDEQNLEVMVMLEVNVRRGNDHEVVLVLNVGEFPLEIPLPIVVNERDGSGHTLGSDFLGVIDKLLPSHLGDRVGTVRQFPPPNHVIEFIEQIGRQRNAEAGDFGGGSFGHWGEMELVVGNW